MAVNVLLTVERNGRAVALGRVKNQEIVRQVARQAIMEKRAEAQLVSLVDRELGIVARGELRQIERILGSLISGLVKR
jgi:hypothetical protein